VVQRYRGRKAAGQALHDEFNQLSCSRILRSRQRRANTDAEKAVLARYSGWGALSNVFRPYPPREWEEIAQELRDLLSDEEYEAARASTPNAHYTAPAIIAATWQAMERLGLPPGARVLEPSMGVGHFFGLMPENLLPGCSRTGVELDAITARIAQRFYPDATIFAKAFEETALPDDFFDAVIGNIPFGNYSVFDPAYRGRPGLTRAIHDYFFAKSLDKLQARSKRWASRMRCASETSRKRAPSPSKLHGRPCSTTSRRGSS
jgi:hypothetical protein